MKTFNIVTFFLLFTNLCFGQTASGEIVDKESKKSIGYVNIGIKNTNIGTVSDNKGVFKLNIQSNEDSVIFSSIGYETLIVSADDIIKNEQIELSSIDYKLEGIEIVSSNFDEKIVLGERNENKRGKSFGFGNAQLGTELGALISIKKETLIKSVHFVLNHAKGDSLLMRINIYDYKNGTIGEKVVKKNIYIKAIQRKGTYSIDLSEYEIILKKDVLLSAEWLKDFDETGNRFITFDTKKSKSHKGIYIRSSSNSEFKKLSKKANFKPCIYFIGKQSSK